MIKKQNNINTYQMQSSTGAGTIAPFKEVLYYEKIYIYRHRNRDGLQRGGYLRS